MPRLVAMGYVKEGLQFKYANRIEMNNEDRIKLYSLITDKYEVSADEIEREFGINVGKQLNAIPQPSASQGLNVAAKTHDRHIMSDEEYYKRYGYSRSNQIVNFLKSPEV